MSQTFLSVFLGIFFLICFFAICFFSVIGAKAVWFFIKSKLSPEPAPKEVQPKRKRTKRNPVRSIEINPEETTKIVFKKTS